MGFEWPDPEEAEDERRRRRETRNRVLLSIGITAAICAFVLRTCVAAQEQAESQRTVEAVRQLQDVLDHDLSAFKTPRERDMHPLDDAPAATPAQLEAATRVVCRRMLACGGRSPTEVDNQLDSCVAIQTRSATTSFARSIMVAANHKVLDGCGELGCDRFSRLLPTSTKPCSGGR
jgi:hypothetical protein